MRKVLTQLALITAMELLNVSSSNALDGFLQRKWDAFLDVVGKCRVASGIRVTPSDKLGLTLKW